MFGSLRKNCYKNRQGYYNNWTFAAPDDVYWNNVELETLTWDKVTNGSVMKYTWREYDVSATTTLSIEVPAKFKINSVTEVGVTVRGSVSVNEGDDECGESIVEYCDHANSRYPSDGVIYGERYNTGTVQFEVRERY